MSERETGRQYPDGPIQAPDGWPALTLEIPADVQWPEGAAGFLQNMLGGTPEPGPPYVHTYEPPPVGLDEYKPYRAEVEDTGCGVYWPLEDAP